MKTWTVERRKGERITVIVNARLSLRSALRLARAILDAVDTTRQEG